MPRTCLPALRQANIPFRGTLSLTDVFRLKTKGVGTAMFPGSDYIQSILALISVCPLSFVIDSCGLAAHLLENNVLRENGDTQVLRIFPDEVISKPALIENSPV
eukprot:PhF_6_TR1957/c0_g1_i1/m.3171